MHYVITLEEEEEEWRGGTGVGGKKVEAKITLGFVDVRWGSLGLQIYQTLCYISSIKL